MVEPADYFDICDPAIREKVDKRGEGYMTKAEKKVKARIV